MKFSIVVPVYGVERYLNCCVESLLAQSYSDFEVILVDDCSPDSCPALCDDWERRDHRVRVIHKPVNQGLGFARNTGIEAALGDYILFVDSDDTIAPETLDVCGRVLSQETDILVFGMKQCYENSKGKVTWSDEIVPEAGRATAFQQMAEMFDGLCRKKVFSYACNKVYRRDFLLSVPTRFEQTKLIEDFLFNIDVFGYAREVVAIPQIFYYYRKPSHETLASRYSPDFFLLSKRKFLLEEAFLKKHDALCGAFQYQIQCGYMKHLISAVIKNRSSAAGLGIAKQREAIFRMIEDPLTVRVATQMQPEGRIYQWICNAVRKKKTGAVWLIGTAADLAQRYAKPIYRHFT